MAQHDCIAARETATTVLPGWLDNLIDPSTPANLGTVSGRRRLTAGWCVPLTRHANRKKAVQLVQIWQ
jgi:hypothetical protein